MHTESANQITGKSGKSRCNTISPNDSDRDVRSRAAEALGKIDIRVKEVVPALITALKDESIVVRSGAADALGKIGIRAKEVVPALITALKDGDSDVRFMAAGALGKIGTEAKEAVPALITALEDDNYDDYRVFGYMAISAIARIRGNLKYASANLIEALKLSKYDSAFSDSLASSLVQIGKEAVPVLITALQDKDYIVRYEAAGVLGQIGTAAKEALPELTNVFLNRKNVNYVRYQALRAINTIAPDKKILSVVNIYGDNFMLSPPYYGTGSRVGKVRKVTRNYLAAKPLVVCKVSIIRTLLPWKCPDEKLTENIEPQVDKKTDNPQPPKRP